MSDMEVRVRVLGPVSLWSHSQRIPLAGQRSQVALAVLALHHGKPVPRDRLLVAIWGDSAPATAVTQLHAAISSLRRGLSVDAIETVGTGYMLKRDMVQVDLTTFQSAIAQAQIAAQAEDHVEASAQYRHGFEIWRSDPFEGLESSYLASQAIRLHQLRTSAVEGWADEELALGRAEVVVSELSKQWDADPLRESMAARLMRALYHTGRQAEALEVFRTIRKELAEKLGVEPGPAIQDLHRRMLRADLELEPKTPKRDSGKQSIVGTRVRAGLPPAQLPPGIVDFTGRDVPVRQISDLLSNKNAAASGAPVACLISGGPGVGKTTLAVHVAHLVHDQFPDGQICVDMRSASRRSMTAGQIAGRILRDLGVPEDAIPSDEEHCNSFYRSVLAHRQVLIFLDDVHESGQVRPLLPASGASAVLFTSRYRGLTLPALNLVQLEVMTPADATALFARIIGEDRAAAEPDAVLAVIRACEYLPLALRIAASRLTSRPHWTVATLADRLSKPTRRLDELNMDRQNVRSAFELSYESLTHDQARAFRLLATADLNDISMPAAAALLNVNETAAERLTEWLVDANLLEPTAPSRYRYQELLRLFAKEKARLVDAPTERADALRRLLPIQPASAAAATQPRRPLPLDTPATPSGDMGGLAKRQIDIETTCFYDNALATNADCS